MAGGSAIRGSRVGAGPLGEDERGESAPRQMVQYFCARGHVTSPSFAMGDEGEAPEIPLEWDCPKCGFPAGLDADNPPEPIRNEPFKTHLAYVKERRSEEEGEALLAEALDVLRQRRMAIADS
ncbi:RNA polymerase-binding protein RbpA [Demequina muriae]|uniref:RNA polymerase-binding protein RbpA n=1 Tax=Demequina muriae TaxID=3051664 RepID=A0ABT8GK82_9MICO|nr:RNA polymerase-binding protein RbpA [Demequina sp. EGI L300058]MDN4481832.1 RNA polymerase-binding protein RbpA [Demequina sp. EGI L300058]